jgi:hypothetical protein
MVVTANTPAMTFAAFLSRSSAIGGAPRPLRVFTHPETGQSEAAAESALQEHLSALCERVELLPRSDRRAFIDIDSLLRPVYGHPRQGASYGHTKIAGRQILRKGLSTLVTTVSTEGGAPVITGGLRRPASCTARGGRYSAIARPGESAPRAHRLGPSQLA